MPSALLLGCSPAALALVGVKTGPESGSAAVRDLLRLLLPGAAVGLGSWEGEGRLVGGPEGGLPAG